MQSGRWEMSKAGLVLVKDQATHGWFWLRGRRKTLEPVSGNFVWGLRRTGASIGRRRVPEYASELQSWKAGLGQQDSADWATRDVSRVHVMSTAALRAAILTQA